VNQHTPQHYAGRKEGWMDGWMDGIFYVDRKYCLVTVFNHFSFEFSAAPIPV
jgi:hypothetical protein